MFQPFHGVCHCLSGSRTRPPVVEYCLGCTHNAFPAAGMLPGVRYRRVWCTSPSESGRLPACATKHTSNKFKNETFLPFLFHKLTLRPFKWPLPTHLKNCISAFPLCPDGFDPQWCLNLCHFGPIRSGKEILNSVAPAAAAAPPPVANGAK